MLIMLLLLYFLWSTKTTSIYPQFISCPKGVVAHYHETIIGETRGERNYDKDAPKAATITTTRSWGEETYQWNN